MDESCKNEIITQRKTELIAGLRYCVLPALIVFLLLKVIFSVYFVPTASMEPTIHKRSFSIGLRIPFLVSDPIPKRGDIIVFKETAGEKRFLVKRVIGTPGDKVTIRDGLVFVNGVVLDEPYLLEGATTEANGVHEFEVPAESVFLLGDNRAGSFDSRYWDNPYVSVKDIYAKLIFK